MTQQQSFGLLSSQIETADSLPAGCYQASLRPDNNLWPTTIKPYYGPDSSLGSTTVNPDTFRMPRSLQIIIQFQNIIVVFYGKIRFNLLGVK